MDSGDYYAGHSFVNIFLIDIERYLQNELNQTKTTITFSLTTAPPLNSNLSDTTVDKKEQNASAIEEQFLVEHSSDRQKLVLVNLRVDYQSAYMNSLVTFLVNHLSKISWYNKTYRTYNSRAYWFTNTTSRSRRNARKI